MIYYLLIFIAILDFCWTQYLAYRNRKKMSPDIPSELQGIYDQEKYLKQQSYQKENSRLGLISGTTLFALLLLTLVTYGFGWIDSTIRSYISNPLMITLTFFGFILAASQILSLPFSYYDTFVIEAKYGFNKSTRRMFWADWIKGLILSIVLGGIIVSLLVWVYDNLGNSAWLLAWGIMTVFSLFITLSYSNLIVPIFNKQTPLEEGELRSAIKAFSEKAGFELSDIYVMDASKRTTKANAYFTGLGNKKRIVLYDTLINDLSADEIVAVLAHEIGHYKKKHTVQQLIISIFQTGLLLFLLSFFLDSPAVATAMGSEIPSFHIGIMAFVLLLAPFSLVTGTLMNLLSRKNEYEADAFATSFGLGNSLIEGLKKLSVKSLSNLNPDPLNVFFYYSHPTLLQRILRIKNLNK
ncbi:M48 family metallopeptidase [Dysgonomonas macrotermitis]|uniref:STE24 endopeptidase n=1 Tax=Dysgonomonas macrotermitis TaxID=1346286 RepID=A0A1M5AKU2_9BACT|nr:M48 family metallopeptidase [Dysgonomonas macrotermitis]SHF30737.1 STE24 endopeptidase [Dysgonomonas macrotermitis]